MLGKLKQHKTIVSNTFFLSIIQGINLLVPLIALPYILRTIGIDNYGLIVFAQSIASYFLIVINYGLDVSAVKDVSQNRDDKSKLSQIVSSVFVIKSALMLLSFIVYLGLILLVPSFRDYFWLYIVVFSTCFAEVIFPTWYYQGIEKMAMLTVVRSLSLIFYISTLFFLVTGVDDYIWVPFLQATGATVSSLIGLCMLIFGQKIRFFIPNFSFLKSTFKESTPFFLSRISITVNSNIAKTLSGIFLGMSDVAAFDIARKIIFVAFIPLQMLMQAVYPHNARQQSVAFAKKFFFVLLGLTIGEMAVLYVAAPFIVEFFAGESLNDAVLIIRILLFYLFFGSIANYMGSPVLVAFGYPKPFNFSVYLSTATMLICYGIYFIFDSFSLVNFTIALIVSELAIAIHRYYYCVKYKLL